MKETHPRKQRQYVFNINKEDEERASNRVLGEIEGLLACINPDVDFDTFHEIMGLIYVETRGSHKGLKLLDRWYSNSNEYSGFDEPVEM